MVQIALGYIPILLAQVPSGVLLSRCLVTFFLAATCTLGVPRWGSLYLVATGVSCHEARCPFWMGFRFLDTGDRVSSWDGPGYFSDVVSWLTVVTLGLSPPGMTINPGRSGCFCALARRGCLMGIPLMVKLLTLILRPGHGVSCVAWRRCSCFIRVWCVDNFLLSSKTLT